MNLSSFVDTNESYESLYELIRCLLSFYDGTAKETTSILVVSGIPSSGKTTLTKIIGNLINWRNEGIREINLFLSMNRIPSADLHEYDNSQYISGSRLYLFEEDLVTCDQLQMNIISIVRKFHKAINTTITHRRIYGDMSTITNPAVLLLELNTDDTSTRPFLMYNNYSKRIIKIISLPDKELLSHTESPSDVIIAYQNFVVQCLQELGDIIDIRDIYNYYIKFCIFRQFELFTEIIGHCTVDVSTHVFSLLLRNSITNYEGNYHITGEWLKILLSMFVS